MDAQVRGPDGPDPHKDALQAALLQRLQQVSPVLTDLLNAITLIWQPIASASDPAKGLEAWSPGSLVASVRAACRRRPPGAAGARSFWESAGSCRTPQPWWPACPSGLGGR